MPTRAQHKVEPSTADNGAGPSTSRPSAFLTGRLTTGVNEEGTGRISGQEDFYHKRFQRSNLAELPELQERPQLPELQEQPQPQVKPQSLRRSRRNKRVPKQADEPVNSAPEINYEEIHQKALEMSHLPSDVTLQLLIHYEYDLDVFKQNLEGLVVPDLVPDYVKDCVGANIYEERMLHAKRNKGVRQFYFARTLKNIVNSKSLVDYYYKEKNKVQSNWKLEQEKDKVMNSEDEKEWRELMEKANISILRSDGSLSTAPLVKKNRKRKSPTPKQEVVEPKLEPDT